MEKKYFYIFRHITIYLKNQFILNDDFKESKDIEFLKYFFIDVIDEELLIDNYINVDKDYLNSLIEKHITNTFYIECDRGISHQIIRHRWTHAITMESTRYVKYNKIEVILPNWFYNKKGINYYLWYFSCWVSEKVYRMLIKRGLSIQKARNVLPHSLKTSLYSTMSLSQWKHFLELRMGKNAYPQIIELSENIFNILKSEYPCIFSDFSGK
jgi:thymidylate synthase ThyX